MSNKVFFSLVLIVVGLIGADLLLANGDNTLFMARKFTELSEYIAFWR